MTELGAFGGSMTNAPPDDYEDTWHDHGDETWGWGIHCEDCVGERRVTPREAGVDYVPPWGPSTINPKVDQFLSTGDPSVFDGP